MARNIYYRDFTLCKAVALVFLIVLATAMGGVPHQARDEAARAASFETEARMIPATLHESEALCDVAERFGVRL